MSRYALKIEYDGRPFSGWQIQTEASSVQQTIETALAKLDPGGPIVASAGRTDAGVHAIGQVGHCDMERDWDPYRLSEALNFHLKPDPVAITACVRVDDDWHARFSAVERRYMYRIVVRRAPLVHDVGLAWQVTRSLNIKAMRAGAERLVGHHDFTTFRSTMCQAKSPCKTLDEITIEELPYDAGREIRLRLRARSFLHNQVRSIAGTLEQVGAGTRAPDDVTKALKAKSRTACGPVATPFGLYLTHVTYEPPVFIP